MSFSENILLAEQQIETYLPKINILIVDDNADIVEDLDNLILGDNNYMHIRK